MMIETVVPDALLSVLKWVFATFLAVLAWIVRGNIEETRDLRCQMNKHEKEAAAEISAIKTDVNAHKDALNRIHDRIDEVSRDVKQLLSRSSK
jgi:septal ring factor EnvC (AmiA/AmiB activator)